MGLSSNKNNITRKEQCEWLDNVLENASKDDIVWMCSIKAGIHKNQVFNEKLSWNVIDKAGLADEAEIKRRRQFKKEQRRRHIIRVCSALAVFAILIIILAVNGVFDRDETYYYEYDLCNAYNSKINTNDTEWYNKYQDRQILDLKKVPAGKAPDIDEEILDNTMYALAEQYCASNDFVIDDYKTQKICEGKTESGKYALLFRLALACYDIKKSPDNSGKNMYYTDFYAYVYPDEVKTGSNVTGIYMCSIKDEKADKIPGLYRNFAVHVEPASTGYYISIEEKLLFNGNGICGNALTDIYEESGAPVATSFSINKDLKENKIYTFNNSIATFKIKFIENGLMLKYCYAGDNINNKDYIEIPKI